MVLGLNQSIESISIATNSIFADIQFFYIYTVSSFFKISVYPLQNRVTDNTLFDSYIVSRNFDHILIASATILWLILATKGKVRLLIVTAYSAIILKKNLK
jgi:hypothetical protein